MAYPAPRTTTHKSNQQKKKKNECSILSTSRTRFPSELRGSCEKKTTDRGCLSRGHFVRLVSLDHTSEYLEQTSVQTWSTLSMV